MRYLLEYNGRAAFCEMVRDDSSDYYGVVQRAFKTQAGGDGDRFAFVSMTRLESCEVACGVQYTWGLASCEGAAFELLAMPDTTAEQIAAAKKAIRADRDVVSMGVRRISEIIPFTQPARSALATL